MDTVSGQKIIDKINFYLIEERVLKVVQQESQFYYITHA